MLAYKCQHEQAPSYLSSVCAPLPAATTRLHQGDLDFPRTRTVTYGSRVFAVSGPTCWNALPPSLKSPSLKSAQFCSLLKTTLKSKSNQIKFIYFVTHKHNSQNSVIKQGIHIMCDGYYPRSLMLHLYGLPMYWKQN